MTRILKEFENLVQRPNSWTKFRQKFFRVFLLVIHCHLYSFALRFLFLQTHATSYSFYSSVIVHFVHCKGDIIDRKTVPPSLWFKKSIQKTQVWQLSRLSQKPQRSWIRLQEMDASSISMTRSIREKPAFGAVVVKIFSIASLFRRYRTAILEQGTGKLEHRHFLKFPIKWHNHKRRKNPWSAVEVHMRNIGSP